ncbi:MAG: hypothetical protein AB1589_05655 [Cyanobacteriota bacterium]
MVQAPAAITTTDFATFAIAAGTVSIREAAGKAPILGDRCIS